MCVKTNMTSLVNEDLLQRCQDYNVKKARKLCVCVCVCVRACVCACVLL